MADKFAHAPAYDAYMGRWSAQIAPLFSDFAKVQDGGRILDVGCGTGALVQHLAGLTRQSHIVGIDLSQPFIESCRSRFADRRISFDVGSALELPYPDAAFDGALSLLVIMLLPEPGRAAREMRRVTRAGGTVAACTWASGEGGLEMNAVFWEEAIKIDSAAENRADRPRYCNRRGELTEVWNGAGLKAVEEVAFEIPTNFDSFDDFWLPLTGGIGTVGVYVAALSSGHRDTLRDALKHRLLGSASAGPIRLRATALAVRGVVP